MVCKINEKFRQILDLLFTTATLCVIPSHFDRQTNPMMGKGHMIAIIGSVAGQFMVSHATSQL